VLATPTLSHSLFEVGYRSEVRLLIKPATRAKFLILSDPAMRLLLDSAEFHTVDADRVMYGWHSIKWYTSFPEVEAINTLVERLAYEEGEEFGIALYRLGEDCTDYETLGDDGMFEVYVTATLSGDDAE
jgi:hypothetical protein